MEKKEAGFLIMRYVILILLAFSMFVFYALFAPVTVNSSYFILEKVFPEIQLHIPAHGPIWLAYEGGSLKYITATFFLKGYYAEIISACIGTSAYFLLLLLNLTTPMLPKKRAKSIIFIMLAFLVLNVIRISLFSFLFYQGYKYFDLTHELTWYLGGTLLVLIIWFSNVFLFKINDIPIYTDIKNLFGDIESPAKKIELKRKKVDRDAEDED